MQRLCCHMYAVVLLLWAQDECTCNHVPCYSFLMSCIIAPFTLAVFIHFVEWHRVVSVQTSSSEYNDLLMSFEASLHSEPLIFVTRAADQTLTPDKGIAEKVSLTLPPTTSQSGYPPVVASVFFKLNKVEIEEEVEQIPWDEIQMCRSTRVCLRFMFCVRVQMSLIWKVNFMAKI